MGTEFTNILAIAMRVVVAVAVAFAGYFLSGPLVRGMHRLAFHRPISRTNLRIGRLITGVILGVLVYFLVVFGFGGGFGLGGSNSSGGDGKGEQKGKIGEKEGKGYNRPPEIDKDGELTIEILGTVKIEKERFYLVGRKEPPRDLKEFGEYLQKHHTAINRINVLITPKSRSDYPVDRLLSYLAGQKKMKFQVKTVHGP